MFDALKHESLATFLGNHWGMIVLLVLFGLWLIEEACEAVRKDDCDCGD